MILFPGCSEMDILKGNSNRHGESVVRFIMKEMLPSWVVGATSREVRCIGVQEGGPCCFCQVIPVI